MGGGWVGGWVGGLVGERGEGNVEVVREEEEGEGNGEAGREGGG